MVLPDMSANKTVGKGTANSVAAVLGSFGMDMAVDVCARMIANHRASAAYVRACVPVHDSP
ncbi:MAG: hypothetical protein ACREUX_21635, partial [Burkholderiales bacterium]